MDLPFLRWAGRLKRVHTSDRRSPAGASLAAETDESRDEESRLKAGCSQDWLPRLANVTYFLIRALKTGGTERIVRIFGGALGKFHAASYSSINRWTIFTEPVIVWWMDL